MVVTMGQNSKFDFIKKPGKRNQQMWKFSEDRKQSVLRTIPPQPQKQNA